MPTEKKKSKKNQSQKISINLINQRFLKIKVNTIEKKLSRKMNLHNDILESIGNTPMVKVNNIDTGKCDLF